MSDPTSTGNATVTMPNTDKRADDVRTIASVAGPAIETVAQVIDPAGVKAVEEVISTVEAHKTQIAQVADEVERHVGIFETVMDRIEALERKVESYFKVDGSDSPSPAAPSDLP